MVYEMLICFWMSLFNILLFAVWLCIHVFHMVNLVNRSVHGRLDIHQLNCECLNMYWNNVTHRCCNEYVKCNHSNDYNLCSLWQLQYIPRNMHMVFALLCFVVVIYWLIFPYPSGLLQWHCGNLTIAPVPAKQPWWIWINTSCEFIMNDCITTTKQNTTKLCAYFLGYTVPTKLLI